MGSKSAIGIGNGICFKQVRDKGGGSYIDPLVRDSIVGLWKFDQNTNESPTRNIIKNTIKDKGGDLELLNFGYKLNSGYNGYATDFTEWHGTYSNKTQTKVTVSIDIYYPIRIISFKNVTSAPSFRIKVSGLPKRQNLYYEYINEEGLLEERFDIPSDGIYTLPATAVSDTPTTVATLINEQYNINIKGITIEQLPLYEGALVTDGKDDMIVSQMTVQEMLGGSNVCTVVSMIHQINLSTVSSITSINNIRSESVAHVCARHLNTAYGKTGIFGYSKQLNTTSNPTLINNILGDKKDYIAEGASVIDTTDKYFVQGYKYNDSLYELSELAVYWTFIANKVLTTDEINQIIAYFKLDKYVTPQVIYYVKRQGLTNDTPDSDWYLKDFSGNGHDMQLYNYAKKGNSGIGKYEVDFTLFDYNSSTSVFTATYKSCSISKILKDGNRNIFYNWGQTLAAINSTKIQVTGLEEIGAILEFMYLDESGNNTTKQYSTDGIYDLPASTAYQGDSNNSNFGFSIRGYIGDCDITITQIPDYEGALVSDGKDDYGHADNLPIFKDYTVAIDRAWIGDVSVKNQCLATKNPDPNWGAFNFELIEGGNKKTYSFEGLSQNMSFDIDRKISYQSKYSYNGTTINVGTSVDGKDLFLFRSRAAYPYYPEAAIWSYILFPYTLSEFLLERQLKKYKLGTLYSDMVEFRPIITGNIPYNSIEISQGSTVLYNSVIDKTGTYLAEGSTVRVYIQPSGIDEVSKITVNGVEYTDLPINPNGFYYADFPIAKSPQKISYAIDEYIRYEDIVQPYPAIINLKQDGKTITWGDKLKVGSEVTFVNHTNLLPDLYAVSGGVQYNGTFISWNTSIRVEKSMVFVNSHSYKKANEPNCILAPQTLRIPNSSYKILGYIPDLTGKGNHGVINNSAYVGMSGANGYKYNWNTWRISKSGITSTITDNSLHITSLKGQYNPNQALFESNTLTNTDDKSNFKVNITGLTSDMKCTFNNAGTVVKELVNGVNEISADLVAGWYGFMITALDGSVIGDCDITIQQIGQYEGSFCLDGVDDYITIPTLAHGGKQVLMKVNLQSYDRYLYDQRNSWSPYLAIVSADKTIAYEYSNKGGKTYIDGILNEHIIDKDLLNITHNITATNSGNEKSYSPNIGTSFARGNFAQMALFDFMLFPEISSEEEIQELNDIVGIEGGYVESPNYYWDAYGKKNTDTDRNLIADQVSKDVANALEVKNVAYNSESGYTDDNGLLLDGVEDHAVNTVIPAVTDFTVIAKRNILNYESAFAIKGDNTTSTAAFVLEYGSDKFYNFGGVNTVEYPNTITVATKSSYNNNPAVSSQGIDSLGLRIGEYRNYYSKLVFYKLMLYTKTIDQLSINMLKNLFERDELIDVNNPIFKKKEL